jgi:putative PEP-CTERM system TPR-repeat lipoprotein
MRSGNKVIIFTSLLIMSLIFGCSESKTPDEYSTLAKESLAKGNTNEAIINLKGLLKHNVKNSEGRFLLGKSYAQKGSWLIAKKELERALDYGYSLDHLLPELAKVYYYLVDIKGLEELAQQSNEQSAKTQNIVKTFLAMTYIKEENYQLGNIALFDVLQSNFDSKYTQLIIAWNYGSESKLEQALSVTNQLIVNHPDFAEAYQYQGLLYYSRQDMENAAISFEHFLAIHPQAIKIRVMYGLALVGSANFEEAEKQADGLLTMGINNPYVNQTKAHARFSVEDFIQAKKFAEDAIRIDGNLVISRVIAGFSAYQLKQHQVAYNHLNAIKHQLTFKHPAKKLLTALKLQLGFEKDAYDDLLQAPLSELDTSLLLSSAMALLKLGRANEADFLLAKAEKKSPNNASVAAQKGMLQLYQNDTTGIASLEHALKLDPKSKEVEFSLAIHYLDNGYEDKALAIAKKLLASQDNKVSGYLLLGIIYANNNLSLQAKANYQKVLQIDPDNSTALFYLGVIADDAGRVLDAVKYYQQVVTNLPGHKAAIQRLSRLELKQNNIPENIAFLSQLAAVHPQNITLILGVAQNLRLNNELTKAIALLENISDRANSSQQFWAILGDNYIQAKNLTKAKACFNKVLALNPNHYVAHLRIIGISGDERNYQQALEYTLSSLERFDNNIRLLLLKANLELLTGNLTSAKTTVSYLQARGISHYIINKVVGELALAQQDYSTAIDNFNELYEKKPSSLHVMLLARSLKFNGQRQEAAKTLESYLAKMIKDHKVRMLLAELYVQFDDTKAIKHLEMIVESEKNNVVVLNNLAMLELKRARPKQALLYAEKAFELKSGLHQVADTYGAVLVAVKHFDSAISVLLKAIKQGSGAETTYLNLTRAYLATDKMDEVKALLDSISDKALYSKVQALM